MADIDILNEFQKPYNYMLHSKEENIDEEYRYRLLSNIFVDKAYSPKDDIKYLYLFGIFPCDNMPASYIPFNYKKLSQNFNRISKNNKFKENEYKDVFKNTLPVTANYKKNLSAKLDRLIKAFKSKHSIYNNLHTMPFVIILIIFWTIVILGFMYILYYYYYSVFNYILAFVLFVLLLFAIIFKMFYIVHNS
jgi:hypothetical protein